MPDATTSNVFPPATASPDFPRLEEEILASWQKDGTFDRSIRRREKAKAKDFVFYDGPPFGNGLPHYGHILASLIKDTVPRFWTMKGFRVERRFGWDCHGLPVEMEVQKTLGLSTQADLEAYGVPRFNEECRSIVLRYTNEWRKTITRLGRWVDFDNDYKTMDPSFMETVWWVFRQLWDKGLVTRGHRVMPYSWACGTPLSNFEANLNYQDVQDPSVTVRFELDGEPGTWFLAWTTTPWTLPSNLALCVGPDVDYVQVEDAKDGAKYVLAEACVPTYFGDPGKAKVLWKKKGRELAGRTYRPLFDYFAGRKAKGAFRVLVDDFVAVHDDKGGVAAGTGIVHVAPAFGEDDHRVATREGIELVDPVDVDGRFTADVTDFAGVGVKEADKGLIKKLKEQGSLFHQATLQHSYPFCWRTDTPLIYKAIPSWFVRVSTMRDRLVGNNEKIHWVPDWVGSRRFGDWLASAEDWNVSRNRYWGSCIPIWVCDDCRAEVCVGSLEELRARSGVHLEDLHKHFVDPVTWTCESCRKGTMRRVPEVFDCWFESGSMPYAQIHYPFENAKWFEANFPADFIGEGLDQTRGWFYTLLVLSTALFDRPAFENVIVNGLVLAADGKKMSKRLKNYTAPEVLMDQYGSDALRFYMLSSPVAEGQNLRMVDDEVKDQVKAVLLPLWNAYRFFSEYANADRYRPRGLAGKPNHPLDRYVLSELQRTIAKVGEAMEGYFLARACRASSEFLETLNNWYIRRSRRRFWKTEDDADKFEAFETLYHVLVTYTKVLAPFLPFLAERVHRNLTGGGESVHLADWPAVDRSLVDDALSEEVALVRRIVSLGHQVRATHKAKTRQPLRLVQVAGVDAAVVEANRDVVLEELNVKRLEILADPASVAKKVVKPDGRVLGPRLKGAAKEVFQLAREGKVEDLPGGRVRVGAHVLEPGEFELAFEAAAGKAVAGEGALVVALDLEIDDELRLEGHANEVVRHVQNLRKDAGYAVGDRIRLFVAAKGDLGRAVDAHAATIQDEVLARELVRTKSGATWDKTLQVDVEGEPAEIGVKRL